MFFFACMSKLLFTNSIQHFPNVVDQTLTLVGVVGRVQQIDEILKTLDFRIERVFAFSCCLQQWLKALCHDYLLPALMNAVFVVALFIEGNARAPTKGVVSAAQWLRQVLIRGVR
jgi:hypothetical protein